MLQYADAMTKTPVEVPDALFDRCKICVGPVWATVDPVRGPASKIHEDLIFRIEPNEDGGTRFRIIQQTCMKLPQPANSNGCLMRAAA